MIRYGKAQFLLDQTEKGKSVRQHYEQVELNGGYVEELHPDPPPACLRHIWPWFIELSCTRSSNGFSMLPLSYTEIDAWNRLNQVGISPYEVKLIKQLDQEFLIMSRKPE